MIDIEEMLKSEDDEVLKELKAFLFKENIRLENEKREIAESMDKLLRDQRRFRTEMDMLNHRIVLEKKRLKDDNLFFEKKMEILQEGFRQLDADRKKFEKDRARFSMEKEFWGGEKGVSAGMEDVCAILFRGVSNPLTLRKRYKDLLKIFHPDNLCGDAELVQMINREYEKRKKAE
ncbi:MAG: hypothetical protein J1E65_00430 [Lachnospiraceae bacterium]|nr:hypothetical protein [Lachnospiraceae bacterium]